MTGPKVFVNSPLIVWWKSFATSQNLYYYMEPYEFLLILNIHLFLTTRWFLYNGTSDDVWLFKSAWYSSCIALVHWGESKACVTVRGFKSKGTTLLVYDLGLKILDLDLVCMEWIKDDWGKVNCFWGQTVDGERTLVLVGRETWRLLLFFENMLKSEVTTEYY